MKLESIHFASSFMALIGLTVALTGCRATTNSTALEQSAPKPTIVLVHGAWADASGWSKVIERLQDEGYPVVAVQNPLTSFADDLASTRRVLDAQKGPLVLVGHSYGGAVISAVAARRPEARALVYVAAMAPEDGETPSQMFARSAPTEILQSITIDPSGFATIDRAKFHTVFAADVGQTESQVLAATQKPIFAQTFDQPIPGAAWKTIPSWYVIATQDKAINPDLQRLLAKKMKARTTEVAASHVLFLSQPEEVARVIGDAARSISR